MHIGINALFLIPGEVGGSETYLRETLRAMRTAFPEIRWTLFTNNENHACFGRLLAAGGGKGGDRCRLRFDAANRYMRIIREQSELPLMARACKVDLLWSPGYTAPLFVHCPQVVSILDMQYKSHPEDLTPIGRFTTDLLVRAAARRSSGILTISEFSRREIVRFFPFAKGKIAVTPLAADPLFSRDSTIDSGSERVLTKSGTSPPYLLSVANTYPHKNLHTLVEAFGRLENKIPHRLVIVGKPRLGEPRFTAALSRIADPGRVTRLQGLGRERLRDLYRHADAFVFPSLYEGFGLPVLEAMLAGTPVVTTRMGSLPEVGGVHARYVDGRDPGGIAEGIMEIIRWTAVQRTAVVDGARDWANRFSWQRTAEATMNCFRSVSAAGNRRWAEDGVNGRKEQDTGYNVIS